MIEVRYAGAVIGRSAIVRELDTRGLFLGITEPMPVGTPVALKIGERTVLGKVAAVSEAQELARAGMRVTFSDPAEAAVFGTPVEAAYEPEPVPVPAPEPAHPPAVASADAQAARTAAPAPLADEPGRNVTGPRRIVVDASSENLAGDAAHAHEGGPDEVDSSGPGTTADGGKKSRRNKRR